MSKYLGILSSILLLVLSPMQAENKLPALFPNLIKPTAAPAAPSDTPSALSSTVDSKTKSVLFIDAKKRAEDYLKAYELMRKDKPASKILFKLANGGTIQNIAELIILDNGTLLLFKTTTSQGLKYEIVPLEEIVSLSHL